MDTTRDEFEQLEKNLQAQAIKLGIINQVGLDERYPDKITGLLKQIGLLPEFHFVNSFQMNSDQIVNAGKSVAEALDQRHGIIILHAVRKHFELIHGFDRRNGFLVYDSQLGTDNYQSLDTVAGIIGAVSNGRALEENGCFIIVSPDNNDFVIHKQIFKPENDFVIHNRY